jgi:hypothetical protein
VSNLFVAPRFDEIVTRLGVGIEPRDPLTGFRVPFGLRVSVDGKSLPPPRLPAPADAPWWDPDDGRERIPRLDTCRHVLVFRKGMKDPLGVRITDPARRYVPRRLTLRLPTPASAGQAFRPALYPGAAYDVPAGALALRGRVKRNGAWMRWARAEAVRASDSAVVGRAHGDERGEFLLLLEPAAVDGAELEIPVKLKVTVYGPNAAPDPSAHPESATDALWDLPLEEVPLGGGADVLAGTALPAGYREGAHDTVSFGPDGPASVEFVFT